MKSLIREKMEGCGGFSLTETLVAITILLMVAALMTGGISLSTRVHQKMVDKANAQVLLSTTLTELRTCLSNIDDVSVSEDKKSITFLDVDTNYYVTISSKNDGIKVGTDEENESMLVTYETASKGMIVECTFDYDDDKKITLVKDIRVMKDGTVLATFDESSSSDTGSGTAESAYLIKNW